MYKCSNLCNLYITLKWRPFFYIENKWSNNVKIWGKKKLKFFLKNIIIKAVLTLCFILRCVFQDPFVLEPSCHFRVDEFGFFLTWKSDGKVWFLFINAADVDAHHRVSDSLLTLSAWHVFESFDYNHLIILLTFDEMCLLF